MAKNPLYVDKIIVRSGETGNGVYLDDGTTLIDKDGNIDAPVTTSDLTTTGNTTLGDGAGDTLKISGTTQLVNDGDILDSNGLELVSFVATATAVNELTVANAATLVAADLNAPTISATGGDTDISIRLEPKGAGSTQLYSDEAGATGATLVGFHDSASPAIADTLFGIAGVGRDAGGTDAETYAQMGFSIVDPTDGAEIGATNFASANGTGAGPILSATIAHDGSSGIVSVGDGAAEGVFQSEGDFDVTLRTGNTTTGTLTMTDGDAGALRWAPSGLGVFECVTTSDAAVGSVLNLKQASDSPALNDIVGGINFIGQDDTGPPGADVVYASLLGTIIDPSVGLEYGQASVMVMAGGSSVPVCVFDHDGTFGQVQLNGDTVTTGLQKSVTVLTSAQIKALAGSPITLVAAIPNAVIKPVTVGYKLNYAGTNVFTEAGQSIALSYLNDAGAKATFADAATGFIDAAADQYLAGTVDGLATATAASVENQPLVVSHDAGEWAGNAGNDNTMTVIVTYYVESFV
jgi:hypothetical protein